MLKLEPGQTHWTTRRMRYVSHQLWTFERRSQVAFSHFLARHQQSMTAARHLGLCWKLIWHHFSSCCSQSRNRSSSDHWPGSFRSAEAPVPEISLRLKAQRLLRMCGRACRGQDVRQMQPAAVSQAPSSSSWPIKTRFLAALEFCNTAKAN